MSFDTASLLAHIEALTHPLVFGSERRVDLDDRIPTSVLEPLASALTTLSARYTDTERTSTPELNAQLVRAYLAYYLPINAAKIAHLLRMIAHHLPDASTLRMLDFGGGPATASVAASFSLARALDVVLVDRDSHMRAAAHQLGMALATAKQISLQCTTALSNEQTFHLIVAANVFNEIDGSRHSQLLSELLTHLTEDGILLIVEPGTLQATRALMQMREELVVRLAMTPLYPCTHRNPCPLLPAPDQWCHAELFFERSTLIRQLDALTGFNKHRIKFSALAVTRSGTVTEGFRVLTPPEKSKVGTSALLCGGDFQGLATLRKRDRTDENRAFERVKMHDRITIEPPPLTGLIEREATVGS